MAKRSKFEVEIAGEMARFSDLRQAMIYAKHMSSRTPGILIQVSAKDGLAGQYLKGETTPEFKAHHTAAFIV